MLQLPKCCLSQFTFIGSKEKVQHLNSHFLVFSNTLLPACLSLRNDWIIFKGDITINSDFCSALLLEFSKSYSETSAIIITTSSPENSVFQVSMSMLTLLRVIHDMSPVLMVFSTCVSGASVVLLVIFWQYLDNCCLNGIFSMWGKLSKDFTCMKEIQVMSIFLLTY